MWDLDTLIMRLAKTLSSFPISEQGALVWWKIFVLASILLFAHANRRKKHTRKLLSS